MGNGLWVYGTAYGLHHRHFCLSAIAAMTKPAADLDRAWLDTDTGAHQKRAYAGPFMRLPTGPPKTLAEVMCHQAKKNPTFSLGENVRSRYQRCPLQLHVVRLIFSREA